MTPAFKRTARAHRTARNDLNVRANRSLKDSNLTPLRGRLLAHPKSMEAASAVLVLLERPSPRSGSTQRERPVRTWEDLMTTERLPGWQRTALLEVLTFLGISQRALLDYLQRSTATDLLSVAQDLQQMEGSASSGRARAGYRGTDSARRAA